MRSGPHCNELGKLLKDSEIKSSTVRAQMPSSAAHAQGDSGRLAVTKWLCTVATDACTRKVPPLPASRSKGPAFKEIDEQELNMQRMMASMQVGQSALHMA